MPCINTNIHNNRRLVTLVLVLLNGPPQPRMEHAEKSHEQTKTSIVINSNNNIWSNGAAGVHSCGIMHRLEWRWGVVSYG